MSTFFVAVIFVCLNSQCDFKYSQTIYSTEKDCTASLHAEMLAMYANNPGVAGKAVCLKLKLPTA
jgi:hypothetical protein